MLDAFLKTDDTSSREQLGESLHYHPISDSDQSLDLGLDIDDLFESEELAPSMYQLSQEEGMPSPEEGVGPLIEDVSPVFDELKGTIHNISSAVADESVVPDENLEPRASRLRIIEHTLVEIQKYIGTVIDLVREELGQEAQPHPSTDHEEIKEALPSQDDFFSHSSLLTLEEEIPFCEESEPEILTIVHAEESIVLPEVNKEDEAHVIHGIFRGEIMITGDGGDFPVPPNYASKSRLVEGDLLKLTISETGALVYKQIGPVKRMRVRGLLHYNPDTHSYSVVCPQNGFKVLTASVSYYKGIPGDEVIIIVPEGGGSTWAAIESINKK